MRKRLQSRPNWPHLATQIWLSPATLLCPSYGIGHLCLESRGSSNVQQVLGGNTKRMHKQVSL
jgi:hypothetical protein